MPEYLSPGVFVEEVPGKLKALEGVSTSTAAFVGPAARGPVAGFPLPFTMPGFPLEPDVGTVFVTSFAEFTRRFGAPLPLPALDALDVDNDTGYLGYAVRAFFDNGGRRCFVTRIVAPPDPNIPPYAYYSRHTVSRGVVYQLLRSANVDADKLYLSSLRGIGAAALPLGIEIRRRSDNTVVQGVNITAYNTTKNEVTVSPVLLQSVNPNEVYIATSAALTSGPTFFGRAPGRWSANISVQIAPSDRPLVLITTAAAAGALELEVQNATSFYVGAIVEADNGSRRSVHEVTAIDGNMLTLATGIGAAVTTTSFVRVLEIDIAIADDAGAVPPEMFRGLSWNANGDLRRHYATVINARSRLVFVEPPSTSPPQEDPPWPAPPPPPQPWPASVPESEEALLAHQPTTATGFPEKLVDFVEEGVIEIGDGGADAYIGVDNGPGNRSGIQAFKDLTEVRLIAAPGRTTAAVQMALISQCELMRYRFAILDSRRDDLDPMALLGHRNLYDTSFAAYYAPWLGVTLAGQTRWLPPSGFMAGICARVDNQRGVWKAPANEMPFNVVDLRTRFTTGEQDILNPRGVNLIRRFDEGGIRVWGARTLSSDPELKYINVRRTLISIEATIERNTQWVVFEPNTPETWDRVAASIRAYLETQWREGALFGRSVDEAFFVRCDETTMTEDDVMNGRLICHIGVAIVRPAEFVIFRIEQITGFAKQ
ncbi:MAG TPA: phage tail sheath subtilisin-like domain-containing protein [Kofleriaceae bacterium]